jgi:sugar lactone lactonase YvrE
MKRNPINEKRIVVTMVALLCLVVATAQAEEKKAVAVPVPVKAWETKRVLLVPESVLYNKGDKTLYVSNINGNPTEKNGKGFISKVSLDGKIVALKWAEGLNAPKGSAIYKDSLYVSDIDRLAQIDLKTGKVVKTYPAEGAVFLNDVAVDGEGGVYVTDMDENNSAIYKLEKGKMTVWLKGPEIKSPNGLHMEEKKLMVGNGDGKIKAVRLKDKVVTDFVKVWDSMIDGLRNDGKGNYIVSDWNGKTVLAMADGEIIPLLDTTASKVNSADLEYIPEKKLLLIPTFFDGKVVAYTLK